MVHPFKTAFLFLKAIVAAMTKTSDCALGIPVCSTGIPTFSPIVHSDRNEVKTA